MKKAKLVSIFLIMSLLASCQVRSLPATNLYRTYNFEELNTPNSSVNIDFKELHNDVIDGMLTMRQVFFYIVQNGFVVKGSNDPKIIELDITCIEGVPQVDIELMISMSLHLIGNYAAQQNFNYKTPTIGADNVYEDFGTVFNDYALKLHIVDDKGTVFYDTTIKPGAKIPVSPKFVMEE